MGNFVWLRRYDKGVGMTVNIASIPTLVAFYLGSLGDWLTRNMAGIALVALVVLGLAFFSLMMRLRQTEQRLKDSQTQTLKVMKDSLPLIEKCGGGMSIVDLAAVAGQLRAINPEIADDMVRMLDEHARTPH